VVQKIQKSEIREYYKKAHKKDLFRSKSLLKWVPLILKTFYTNNCKSIMDYGCGNGNSWHVLREIFFQGSEQSNSLYLYDPYHEKRNKYSITECDLVICIDVMEHVPESDVNEVLSNILCHANKAVFFVISNKPATKTFPSGENIHVTLKNKSWWQAKIDSANLHNIVIHLYMDSEKTSSINPWEEQYNHI